MEEMTMARLNNYRTIERQIEAYNLSKEAMTFIKGVVVKPAVQNGAISDTTANTAISSFVIDKECEELCKEYYLLDEYICGIDDYIVREIAKLKFKSGYTYKQIADVLKYAPSTIQKKLSNYIKNHKTIQ